MELMIRKLFIEIPQECSPYGRHRVEFELDRGNGPHPDHAARSSQDGQFRPFGVNLQQIDPVDPVLFRESVDCGGHHRKRTAGPVIMLIENGAVERGNS